MTTLGPYDYWAIEYAYKPLRGQPTRKRRTAAHRRAQQRAAAGLRHRRGQRLRHRPRDACSSTSAPTRWPSPPSGWPSRATCSSARRRASSRPTRLRGAAPLAGLCAGRRRPRGRRAGAPDRRRAHAARLPRQRARPAAAGCAAMQRQALELIARVLAADGLASPRRCSAGWRPTSSTAAKLRRCPPTTRCRSAAGPAARGARPPDERRPGGAHPRQRGKADRPRAAFRLSELYARLERDVWSELAGRRHRASAARTAARPCQPLATPAAAPSPRPVPTRAACCARRRGSCWRGWTARSAARRGAEARAHLHDSADTLSRRWRRRCSGPGSDSPRSGRAGRGLSQAGPRRARARPHRAHPRHRHAGAGTQPRAHGVLGRRKTPSGPTAPAPPCTSIATGRRPARSRRGRAG